MMRTTRLFAALALLTISLGGCYTQVNAGPGWHRCGWWGWCR